MNEYLSVIEITPLGQIFAIVLGLIWGSFFNVCILRIPEEKSLIPGSHCPNCKTPIPFYLNVPLLSYLILRGRCHRCQVRISPQYPLVEAISALLFLWVYLRYGITWQALGYVTFISMLLVISVIDLYHQIIPDELSLPGVVLGMIFNALVGEVPWWESVLGAVAGGGIFLSIAFLYEKMTKREGLGGGDVKLLAMIGAWLGVKSLLVVILTSCTLGSVVGLAIMWIRRKDFKHAIPFGPFLAVGALIQLFWGTQINLLIFPDLP